MQQNIIKKKKKSSGENTDTLLKVRICRVDLLLLYVCINMTKNITMRELAMKFLNSSLCFGMVFEYYFNI